MLKITPLTDTFLGEFYKAFEEYYRELGCDDNCPHLLDEYVLPDLLAGLLKIDVLFDGEAFAGFIIYQIDEIDNDWNFKEGFGDIREIYVAPSLRKKGYGKFLLYTAEMKLKESGATACYALPFEDAEKFFLSCGYKKTEEFCDELDCGVFVKENLNNCECGGNK